MILVDEKLESIVHDDPTAEASWQVYADALLGAGDPRGEIITMGITGRHGEIDRLLEIYREELFADALSIRDGEFFENLTWTGGWEGAAPEPLEVSIDYELSRYGMIDTVTVEGLDEEGHVAKAVEALLSCPLGRFVRLVKLSLGERFCGASGSPNYDLVLATMTRARPLSLRCLEIASDGYQLSWTDTGNLGPLLCVARRLEEIDIEHGRISFGNRSLDLPRLRHLRLESGGLPAETIATIGSANWPALERLTLFFGAREYGGTAHPGHLAGLLERPEAFPSLRHLALCNSEIQGAIVNAVATSPLLPQLVTLDFSKGILDDEEAKPLLEHARAFAHLEKLDLSENYLSPSMAEHLQAVFPRSDTNAQRYDEMLEARAQYGNPEWATTGFRYTAIAE